ncbi:hypothetical protein MHK_010769 [Candidatus Magnetomorum sp. HK-1]|nr:hypothetical protein MHK_010769 [Candidatus Magnetomorum sp. HK-1]
MSKVSAFSVKSSLGENINSHNSLSSKCNNQILKVPQKKNLLDKQQPNQPCNQNIIKEQASRYNKYKVSAPKPSVKSSSLENANITRTQEKI